MFHGNLIQIFAIDAFTLKWNSAFYYMFPPFAILGQVISKIKSDKSKCILIIPDWPNQFWYPIAISSANKLFKIPQSSHNLTLPHDRSQSHPINPKLIALQIN